MSEPSFTVADHELICRIGKGSYGEVWLARNVTGRLRAIKVVFRDRFKTSNPFDRELSGIRQFEPISRTHEGFVDILQVGENKAAGYFYYVMEAADDLQQGAAIKPEKYEPDTLAARIGARKRLAPEECIRIGITLARALCHLHGARLLHRDIKPSNIIFIDGAPRLADIGLVTSVDNAVSYVGTEGFIPPEGPGTEQADIFSLGKVLYEAASGKDRQLFPELPTELGEPESEARFIELNEIIVKSCHPDVRSRYASARDMLTDLLALEAGQSIRRLRVLERNFKLIKRAAVLTLLAVGFGTALLAPYLHSRNVLKRARLEKRGALLADARRELDAGNLLASLPKFTEALELETGDTTRENLHRLRIGAILAYVPKLTDMRFIDGELSFIEFSPDGSNVIAVQRSEAVWLYSLLGEKKLRKLAVPRLNFGCFSPDGKMIVTADRSGAAIVWDSETLQKRDEFQNDALLEAARFSHGGGKLVTGGADGVARIWDIKTHTFVETRERHGDKIIYCEFSPNDSFIVTASADATAQLWNALTGEKIGPPLRHKSWVNYAAFSPDGARLATAGFDKQAILWEVATGRQISLPLEHEDTVISTAFSPDGMLLATAGLDGFVKLWNAQTGRPIKPNGFIKHSSRVEHVAFSPDSRQLLTACLDGTIRLLDFAHDGIDTESFSGTVSQNGAVRASIKTNEVDFESTLHPEKNSCFHFDAANLLGLSLSENGRFALTLLKKETNCVALWNTATGARVSEFIPAPPGATVADFNVSENGKYVAERAKHLLTVFDAPTGRTLASELTHDGSISQVRFDKDSKQLAVGSGDSVSVWRLDTFTRAFPAMNLGAMISVVQFSPNSHELFAAVFDASFRERAGVIIDIESGSRRGSPLQHRDGVKCGAFSPLGNLVATGGEDFSAMVWTILDSKPLSVLPHSEQVWQLAFSHDQNILATWTRNEFLQLWDTQSGEPLSPKLFCEKPCTLVAFVPNSREFFTVSGNNQALRWMPKPENRPLKDLESLTQLLSNQWPFSAGTSNAQVKEAWQNLKAKYPMDFKTRPVAIANWHHEMARLARANKNEWAIRFHEDKWAPQSSLQIELPSSIGAH